MNIQTHSCETAKERRDTHDDCGSEQEIWVVCGYFAVL